MIETTDEQWEEFERKYGDKGRSIRTKGFPWVESLMKQVWPGSLLLRTMDPAHH
ncbi:hypothetical protein E4U39_002178, partial [Claviceps sp. Clav50 group G5]